MEDSVKKLMEIMIPYFKDKIDSIHTKKTRIVHYTSAEAGYKIIKNKEIWLRQPDCMNDFREIHHGIDCLVHAYDSGDQKFKKALDLIAPNFSLDVEAAFRDSYKNIKNKLFIACVSEHDDGEDLYGRLSMWRAYGSKAGIAIVFKNDILIDEEDFKEDQDDSDEEVDLNPEIFLPVSYLHNHQLKSYLDKLAKSIIDEIEFLKGLDYKNLNEFVVTMLKWLVVSTKHPGFEEEREWRMIYCPADGISPMLIKGQETIGGIPQEIYKLSLEKISKGKDKFHSMNTVIDKILIGPCSFPEPIKKSFIDLLIEVGVENAEDKVIVSEIPLRT